MEQNREAALPDAIVSGCFVSQKDAHRGTPFVPRWRSCFIDPKKIDSHCGGREQNAQHSGVIGCGCDKVRCRVTGNDCLPGAHSATVNAKAQCTIMVDEHFSDFVDKPVAMIATMADAWALQKKKQ